MSPIYIDEQYEFSQSNVRVGSLTDILRALILRPLYPRKRTLSANRKRVRYVPKTDNWDIYKKQLKFKLVTLTLCHVGTTPVQSIYLYLCVFKCGFRNDRRFATTPASMPRHCSLNVHHNESRGLPHHRHTRRILAAECGRYPHC